MRVSATLLFSLLLTVCAAAVAADKPRSFEQILESGELRAGVALFAPWTLRGKDQELIGSEIDMGRRLAQDMGLEVKFEVYEWEELIPALQRGGIDIIIGGMSVTPERALKVNFSDPYGGSGVGLATNTKLTAEFDSLKRLNSADVAIAATRGTVAEQVARRMFGKASIKTFDDQEKAIAALRKGLVHALAASEPTPRFLALQYPQEIDEPLTQPLLETREAFAVRKGQHDFINFLDAWIVARSADAWLSSTRQYWFESLRWRELVDE